MRLAAFLIAVMGVTTAFVLTVQYRIEVHVRSMECGGEGGVLVRGALTEFECVQPIKEKP